MSLENKVVIITGAGSGIGEAIAVHFAKSCVKLSLVDNNAESLQDSVQKCEKLSGIKVLKNVADMTNDESVKQTVDKTVEEFGRIDVVINCAGISGMCRLLDDRFINKFDGVMAVNFRAYVILTHYVAPALIKTKGCIINIASTYANLVDHKVIPYTTSKAAVVHFTRNAALELAEEGVRVNSISPGVILTTNLSSDSTAELDGLRFKKTPLEHLLKVEEIAQLASYLASDNAQSITGADFVIDSGLSLLGILEKDV